jgi:hypothetical protein
VGQKISGSRFKVTPEFRNPGQLGNRKAVTISSRWRLTGSIRRVTTARRTSNNKEKFSL